MMIRKIINEINILNNKIRFKFYWWLDHFCSFIPGELGVSIRRLIYRGRMSMGDNVVILEGVRINYPERMKIGDNSIISQRT